MQALTLTALAASLAYALPSNTDRDGSRIEITPNDNAASMNTNAIGPDPGKVYVNGLTYGGSGCPQGSVGVAFSPDRTSFTAIFDSFVASSGRNIPVTEQRKNCQVNLDLRYPNGWQYSIAEVDYRGFVALPPGVTAQQKANYYFSGESRQVSSQTTFQGPYNNDYLASDKIPLESFVWSPCGAKANGNINAQVRLSGSPGALAQGAQITVDSIDGKVRQIFGIQWRRC